MTRKRERGGFHHIETWVFDLDNTLYPASCRLFDGIDKRMGEFISSLLEVDAAQARRVQKQYFFKYGTTLRGLMTEHNVCPEEFLAYVHDIDHSPVAANAALGATLDRLPGRKLIFTNGTVAHAERVLDRLEIKDRFDDVFDIKAAEYLPKPEPETYRRLIETTRFEASRAAMFEDIARNLESSHALGMTTVLVHSPDNEDSSLIDRLNGEGASGDHIHHVTDNLNAFLATVVEALDAGHAPTTGDSNS